MAKQNEQQLDQFNQSLRANPQYQAYLNSLGITTDTGGQAWRLSDSQRKQAAQWVTSQYGDLGKGMEVDISGNVNQNEGFGKQAKKWGPIVGAGALAAFGMPGLFPGLLTGGGAATGGTLGGLYAATPANIASQGVSAGLGAGATAGAAGGGGMWGWLSKLNPGDVIGAVGGGLSSRSQASATNRGEKLSAQMDLQRLLMDRDSTFLRDQILREAEGRAGATDAYRKLLSTQRTLSPTPRANADNPYASPGRTLTGLEREGATALSDEVMKRLRGGNPITPAVQQPMGVDMGLADPGIWEQIFGIAGPAAQGYGMYDLLRSTRKT